MKSTVIVYVQQQTEEKLYFSSGIKRSDLHLGESQRVIFASPATPVDAISVRRVFASQIATVEVGVMTCTVPPGTFVRLCTWAWPHVVVLVSSAEHSSAMPPHWITFHRKYKQRHILWKTITHNIHKMASKLWPFKLQSTAMLLLTVCTICC